MKVARAIISIFITIPIWIYLVYKIMVAVNATSGPWEKEHPAGVLAVDALKRWES